MEHQIEVDEYLTAGRLVKIAANAAGRTSSSALSATVAARGRDVEAMRQGFDAIEKERTILAKAPNDPVAAGRVGRFLCLLKGDWLTGLPMLAKSEDEVLKAIAKKDLAGPPMFQRRWKSGTPGTTSARGTTRVSEPRPGCGRFTGINRPPHF